MAEFGLGAYLIEHGVVDREQLAVALEAQVVYGGRLGTNLVELGILDVDQVAAHLAAAIGIPAAPPDWVDAPDPQALLLLPKSILEERGVLPLRAEGRRLHVALLDADDQPLLGALTRVSGRSIVPYVLPELRLRCALERHAGIARPLRFVEVAKELEQQRPRREAEHDDRPEEVRAREALGIRPLDHGEDLIDETDFADLHQRLVEAREQAAGGPATALTSGAAGSAEQSSGGDSLALEAALAAACNRNDAALAAIAIARRHVEAAAILVVHRGLITGLLAAGGDLAERIQAVVIPIDAVSSFANAARGELYRGAAPTGAFDARVLRALGRAGVREMALLPVSMRGRTVNLLYVDGGERPLAETALGALFALTGSLAQAYERIILARKQLV